MQRKELHQPKSLEGGWYGKEASAKGGKQALQVYGGPITQVFTTHYPHLKPFEGSLLLGNDSLQAVFAAVPEEHVPNQDWQDGLIGLFSRQGGLWGPELSLRQIALKRLNQKGLPFFPIASDSGLEEGGLGFLTILYSDQEVGGVKSSLTWRLSPEQPLLYLVTSPLQEDGHLDALGRWQLQVLGPKELCEQAATNSNMEADEESAQLSAALVYAKLCPHKQERAQQGVAIFGLQPFQAAAGLNGQWHLTPQEGASLGLHGFAWFPGASPVAYARTFIASLQVCRQRYQDALSDDYASEERFHLLSTCQQQVFGTVSP